MVTEEGADLETLVDGTFFRFPASWEVAKFDEWPQYRKPAGELHLQGCDIVALDGDVAWLIEVKDYTYPAARQPDDLSVTVGQKAVGTMALLFALKRSGNVSPAARFAAKCHAASTIRLALHVEVKDGGRKGRQVDAVLAPLKQKMVRTQKALGLDKSYVTSTLSPHANTPWTARRDPRTRPEHADR